MSVKHDHEHERKAQMMSRLQHQQPHKEGLALCPRVILDSVAHCWVSARTPTVHQCLHGGRPWVARHKLHETTTDKRQHDKDKVLRQMCFQETGVDTHLQSYMAAEPVREAGDLRRDVVKLREQTRRQQSRSGDVPDHQEDQPRDQAHQWNETTHIKITQSQCTDKVVDVTVVIQGQESQIQTTHRKSWSRRPNEWNWVGPPIPRTCMMTLCERHLK